jgi:hypothetical protein
MCIIPGCCNPACGLGLPEHWSAITRHEQCSRLLYYSSWILELKAKISLCAEDGWFPWVSQECRKWFTDMWPKYTQRIEYEQKIYELQRDAGLVITVPRHMHICPTTLDQGRVINAKFEQLAEN